jgi:taurine dioxygenase
MTVRPLSPVLGAEVLGVDLREELDPGTARAIRAAWLDHQVLVFRGQQLSPDHQVRFTALFGEPSGSHRGGPGANDAVKILTNVSNPDDATIQYHAGAEMEFHQDGVYTEYPTKVSFLYALAIPSAGGNTAFANMYRAYETLPTELRSRVEGLDVLFNFFTNLKRGVGLNLDVKRPEFVHPLVVAHPLTGRPLLLCNRLMTDSILGLSADESAELLATLYEHIERPENVYEHVWRLGDLVMWDNLATAHARTDFDMREARAMQRTTIAGERPHAFRRHAAAHAAV